MVTRELARSVSEYVQHPSFSTGVSGTSHVPFNPYKNIFYPLPLLETNSPEAVQEAIFRRLGEAQQQTRDEVMVSGYNERYEIISSITLQVMDDDDGSVIVHDVQFSLYGVGDTIASAVSDFFDMMTDMYEEYASAEDELSSALRRQLGELRKMIRPR